MRHAAALHLRAACTDKLIFILTMRTTYHTVKQWVNSLPYFEAQLNFSQQKNQVITECIVFVYESISQPSFTAA